MSIKLSKALLAILLPVASTAIAQGLSYGPQLEGFEYPHEVKHFVFVSQGQPLSMAYLDVAPSNPGKGTVVLLHGKNFCAATWESAIAALVAAGYRVIAPDQVGFCKSSKPPAYQFSFGQLAFNTHALLEKLGIEDASIVGHSMGGMLAVRHALQYPRQTTRLLLVNPIGLEDWKAEGVPWRSVDAWQGRELATDLASIRKYQQEVYYGGQWKPAYDRWADMLAGMYAGPGKQAVAWNQALASDMVFNQPVVYELPQLRVPTILFIGQRDRTTIGKDLATPELARRLGNYPALGRRAAAAIPAARLVEFADLGHSPQVEDPERFNAALLDALSRP